jgi:hypothetical protein
VAFIYNNAVRLLSASYWTTATIQAMVVLPSPTLTSGSSYLADRDDVFVSAVGNSEMSGSGYTRGYNSPGRKTLSSMTVVTDNTANTVRYGAANLSFSTISVGEVGAIILFEKKTTDADSPLLAYIDASAATTTNGTSMPVLFENGFCFTVTT